MSRIYESDFSKNICCERRLDLNLEIISTFQKDTLCRIRPNRILVIRKTCGGGGLLE
jgi:hypothetical protein